MSIVRLSNGMNKLKEKERENEKQTKQNEKIVEKYLRQCATMYGWLYCCRCHNTPWPVCTCRSDVAPDLYLLINLWPVDRLPPIEHTLLMQCQRPNHVISSRVEFLGRTAIENKQQTYKINILKAKLIYVLCRIRAKFQQRKCSKLEQTVWTFIDGGLWTARTMQWGLREGDEKRERTILNNDKKSTCSLPLPPSNRLSVAMASPGAAIQSFFK